MIAQKVFSAYRTAVDRDFGVMIRAVGRLSLVTFQRVLMGRRYLMRPVHDYHMMLDTRDKGLSRSLLLFRTREVDHKVMLEHIVKPGMTVFDIGGNIGYYPLMELGLLGGTGKIIIAEPSPENVALMRQNLELNGYNDITIIQTAVSDKPGTKLFHLSEQSNLGTFHPIGSGSETLTGEKLDVETVTIPMLAEEFGPPDLIRMDVEGHEVEVLNGMVDDLRSNRYAPLVIFETHLTRYGPDHDMAKTLRDLFEIGYRVVLAASSSDQSTDRLKSMGYKPGQRIATDGIHRTLFSDIRDEDAINIIANTGGFRTVLLAKE